MIAGGAEACIHPLAIGGFARSRSLATTFNDEPQVSSRPFDRDRAGFVIGEGAACVILEVGHHHAASLTGYHLIILFGIRSSSTQKPEAPESTPN
jgi:3-oxoacyl-(acyl-carrier-protein) synthase